MTAARSSVSIAGGGVRRPPCEAVEAPGEVGLVGARAVVVGAAGVDGEAQRHRLQRARLVAGQLEALDVRRRSARRRAADPRGRARGPRRSRAPRPVAARRSRRARAAAPPRRRSAATARRCSPRSAHSIAHAIVPPVEIVSSPSSSQRPLAASTASGSTTPHSGPSAKTFSYSTRAPCRPRPAVDVLAADGARRRSCRGRRRAPRRGPRRPGRGASRTSPAGSCAWAASRCALKASRLASVPSSRYLAVAGPNERARRSRAAAQDGRRVGGRDLRSPRARRPP